MFGNKLLNVLALSGLLLLSVAHAQTEPPTRYFENATIPRVRALALDAALLRGWKLHKSAAHQIIFEHQLATAAHSDQNPPGVVRIFADFFTENTGVRMQLRAEEIHLLGNETEWREDVTATYRDNLSRALDSLQQQWRTFTGSSRATPFSRPAV